MDDDAIKAAREAGERIQERIEQTGDDAKATGARVRDFMADKAEDAGDFARDTAEDAGDAAKAAWEKVKGDDESKS